MVAATVPSGVPPAAAQLVHAMMASSHLARERSTWAKYAPHWAAFTAFCAGCRISPYQAGGTMAAAFLTKVRLEAQERGVGPQAVKDASAAISAYCSLVGAASPSLSPLCKNVVEVAQRTLQPKRLDRPPADVGGVAAIVARHIRPGCDLLVRMHVTVAVLCFAGQLRFSDAAKILVHHDLLRLYDDRVEVWIYKRKNDPRAAGDWFTIGACGGPACPVGLLADLLVAGGYKRVPEQRAAVGRPGQTEDAEDVGPLLRAVRRTGAGHVLEATASPMGSPPIPPLSYGRFRQSLGRLSAAAGLPAQHFMRTHALRIGGTSAAVNAGVPRALVQKAGGWKSTACFERHYALDGPAQRAAVARAIMGAGA